MRIVSILSKLLKTVGLLAVRLELAELRWKNRKKMSHFWQKSKFRIFDKNLNPYFRQKYSVFGCHNKKVVTKKKWGNSTFYLTFLLLFLFTFSFCGWNGSVTTFLHNFRFPLLFFLVGLLSFSMTAAFCPLCVDQNHPLSIQMCALIYMYRYIYIEIDICKGCAQLCANHFNFISECQSS